MIEDARIGDILKYHAGESAIYDGKLYQPLDNGTSEVVAAAHSDFTTIISGTTIQGRGIYVEELRIWLLDGIGDKDLVFRFNPTDKYAVIRSSLYLPSMPIGQVYSGAQNFALQVQNNGDADYRIFAALFGVFFRT